MAPIALALSSCSVNVRTSKSACTASLVTSSTWVRWSSVNGPCQLKSKRKYPGRFSDPA
ncbi:Uncharacterised protein [Mycobacterium tuberculosis]|uniref:Uncharacterized protein n=1 Tax=Mycobacterium tuberculosis TaxID=1773 RepID=A0A655IFQ8_MYCTX|nr:Uncharacterised protein [Mycobacterium tuberculosis]COW12215.1 Uncharacterised protein [Mycobacterium tuberculosis]COX06525.1 Uncharacterised protein [Mycobacterium tuberculosis]COZ44768.1 Uncharacterised protein [Mycobacterium tuberculosis]COZ56498.1 Uncharacterised protein [Mycobacterium tuberculosis]